MKFTVVIQSYLGAYENAAKDRDKKILRAIDSVLAQTYKDFEIMVVADGCEKTFNIIEDNYSFQENVDCLLIKKQPMWSGVARNYGIGKAVGEYIVYLDIDDYFGENHLQIIADQLGNYDWVWFNDQLKKKDGTSYERNCLINQRFQNGTSNICHKKSLPLIWKGSGYGLDDWGIVQQLHRFTNFTRIKTPEYIVCHLVQGLDL